MDKRNTYNAKSQAKYNQKRKNVSFMIMNDEYDKMIQHLRKKGFTSVSSYLKFLVNQDMSTPDV